MQFGTCALSSQYWASFCIDETIIIKALVKMILFFYMSASFSFMHPDKIH